MWQSQCLVLWTVFTAAHLLIPILTLSQPCQVQLNLFFYVGISESVFVGADWLATSVPLERDRTWCQVLSIIVCQKTSDSLLHSSHTTEPQVNVFDVNSTHLSPSMLLSLLPLLPLTLYSSSPSMLLSLLPLLPLTLYSPLPPPYLPSLALYFPLSLWFPPMMYFLSITHSILHITVKLRRRVVGSQLLLL